MDYSEAKFWLDAIQVLGIVLLGIYQFLSNRHKVNKEAIDQVDQRVHDLRERLIKAESAIKYQPSHEDLKRIYDRLDKLGEAQSMVAGEMNALVHQLQLISRHLLEDKQ